MIKINKLPKPAILSDTFVQEKTIAYKVNKKLSPWKHQDIAESLRKETNDKCCYCESKIGQQDSFPEVEHFKPKSKYEDDVLEWNNLICVCSRCNKKKSDHDVIVFPIVNPTIDRPNDHIQLSIALTLIGNTEKGKLTIALLDLNNKERIYAARCLVIYSLYNKISEIETKLSNISDMQTAIYIKNTVEDVLTECQGHSEFSALCATITINSEAFKQTAQKLKSISAWTEEMESMLQAAYGNAFLMR